VAAASVAVVVVAALGSAAIGASFALDRGLRQQGRHPEQSLDWFDRAITLAPENAAHRRAAGFAAEQAAVATTDRVRRKQLIADSVGHYEAALERQPDDVAIMVDLARVLLLRAQSIDPRGYVESARWWSAAVERDPHDWELRELSGLAHTEWANRSGDPAARRRAELDLAAVVDLRPDYYNGWLNLARTQIALGELDAADASIDRAFDIVPYSAPAIEVHEDLDQARARALSS
jgi:tetratricopeptide (TPR) repeat protein